MFLSELKIWNFRKYGPGDKGVPGLHLYLNKGLNLLVGEKDSGKTAIVDAIKFVLQTQSYDYQMLKEEDISFEELNDNLKRGNSRHKILQECVMNIAQSLIEKRNYCIIKEQF